MANSMTPLLQNGHIDHVDMSMHAFPCIHTYKQLLSSDHWTMV